MTSSLVSRNRITEQLSAPILPQRLISFAEKQVKEILRDWYTVFQFQQWYQSVIPPKFLIKVRNPIQSSETKVDLELLHHLQTFLRLPSLERQLALMTRVKTSVHLQLQSGCVKQFQRSIFEACENVQLRLYENQQPHKGAAFGMSISNIFLPLEPLQPWIRLQIHTAMVKDGSDWSPLMESSLADSMCWILFHSAMILIRTMICRDGL